MVLRDQGVDEYIQMEMTEIDLYDESTHKSLSIEMFYEIQNKLQFRRNMLQKISMTKLDYMMKVLRIISKGKYSIPDPDAFKAKVKQMERSDRRKAKEQAKLENNLLSMASSSSFGSSKFQSSHKTGLSGSYSAASSNQD